MKQNAVDIDDLMVSTLTIVLLIERVLQLLADNRGTETEERLSTAKWLLDEVGASARLAGVRKTIEENINQAEQAILNWGLVMLWGAFEAVLEDLLLVLFRKNPNAFQSWGGQMQISFEQLEEFEDLAAAKEVLFEKAIRSFSAESISTRIDILKRRFNVRREQLFSLELRDHIFDNIEPLYWDEHTLQTIANQRNDVVHKRALPIVNYAELAEIEHILSVFLINVGSVISIKASIPLMWGGKPI
jgi:hypothetical protein